MPTSREIPSIFAYSTTYRRCDSCDVDVGVDAVVSLGVVLLSDGGKMAVDDVVGFGQGEGWEMG